MTSKKIALVILAAALLSICIAIYTHRGDLMQGAQSRITSQLKAKSGGECWYAALCGNLAYYDCGEVDGGPSYYVDLSAKQTVGSCGGKCKGDMLRCQNECPPRGWTCDPHQEVTATTLTKLLSLNEDLGKERGLKAVLSPFDPPYPLAGSKEALNPVPTASPAAPASEGVFAKPGDKSEPAETPANP